MNAKEAKQAVESKYKIDPFASRYPWASDESITELAEDIKKTRQIDAIIRRKSDAAIIDGRHRLAACLIAGVKPRIEDWQISESDSINLMQSRNRHRRHLTRDQLLAISVEAAREIVRRKEKENKEKNKSVAPEANLKKIDKLAELEKAAEDAGSTLRQARKMDELVAKDPKAARAVREGKKTLAEARKQSPKIKKPDEAKSILKEVKDAKKERLLSGDYKKHFEKFALPWIKMAKAFKIYEASFGDAEGFNNHLFYLKSLAESLETWAPDKLKPCPQCKGTNHTTDPGGRPCRCQICANGKVGKFYKHTLSDTEKYYAKYL